jgi:hypothetical protein
MIAPRAYLIGMPGSGKSTLMASVTAGLPCAAVPDPFAHTAYFDLNGTLTGVQLGARHDEFPGTDRLSMSVQPAAIKFVDHFTRHQPDAAIVAEGDRLATGSFLEAFNGQLVWLDTPIDVAAHRAATRTTDQNPSWVTGRATKIANLLAYYPHTRLNGNLPPQDLAREAMYLVPAFRHLAGIRTRG